MMKTLENASQAIPKKLNQLTLIEGHQTVRRRGIPNRITTMVACVTSVSVGFSARIEAFSLFHAFKKQKMLQTYGKPYGKPMESPTENLRRIPQTLH